MTGWRGLLAGRRPGRSAERDEGPDEDKAEDDAVGGPQGIGSSIYGGGDETGEASQNRQDGSGKGQNEDGALRGHEFEVVGWETLHCCQSLFVSAFAAIMLVIADLAEPGPMEPWQVLGGLGGYFTGVLLFFALERRVHRKRRAMPVADRTGGGRFALVFMAAAFCFAGGEAMAGLAGWISMSALALGCAADGAWLALVAGRRRVGLWGALRALQASAPTAQERYWAALFGREGR